MDEGLVSCDGGFIPGIRRVVETAFFSIRKSHQSVGWNARILLNRLPHDSVMITVHKITKVDDFISCDRRRRI